MREARAGVRRLVAGDEAAVDRNMRTGGTGDRRHIAAVVIDDLSALVHLYRAAVKAAAGDIDRAAHQTGPCRGSSAPSRRCSGQGGRRPRYRGCTRPYSGAAAVSGHMVAPPSSVMFSSVSRLRKRSSASGSMTIMRFVKEPARMTLPPSSTPAMVHVVSCVMVTVPQIRMTGFLLLRAATSRARRS